MAGRWYMVLDDEENAWFWCAPDELDQIRALQTFARYTDAYADAKDHGCSGTPAFARAAVFHIAKSS